MKIYMKLLLVALAAVAFTACKDDDDDYAVNKSTFTGTVTSGGFSLDGVTVNTVSYEENKKTDITFKQVTFNEKMPKVDMTINGFSYTVNDGDTLLTASDIKITDVYTMTSGEGKITKDGIVVSATIKVMGKEVEFDFEGRR